MNISLTEKKPHGLLLGGFSCPTGNNSHDQLFGLRSEMDKGGQRGIHWSEQYAAALNRDGYDNLLVQGLFYGLEPYRSFGNHRIATHIRKRGWDVECIDYGILFTHDELIYLIDQRITEDTLFVGFSMMFTTTATDRLLWVTDHIREKYPWVTIVAGGQKTWTVTCVEADYYITGNGEFAMDALLDHLYRGAPEPVAHKTLNNGGKLITAYKSYPCFPKRDANISFEERDFIQPNETINIEFARGCIFACKYCSFPLTGMKEDTTRDEDSIHQEMLEHYEKWGITNYYVTDDTINDSKDKIATIARACRRLSFQTQFAGYVRADLLITHGKETWQDMCDMGLTIHHYGVETFNHKAGKTVGKGMKPEIQKKGLLEVKEFFNEHSPNFYAATISMIAGLPFETFESLDASKKWMNENWSEHIVHFLPLALGKPDDEQADETDWKVYNNFMSYGYTYSYDVPYIENDDVRSQVEIMIKEKAHNKNRENNKWNFWVHPSGDYDFIDMIDWVREYSMERVENKMMPAGCWQTNFVHAETWEDPRQGSLYYKTGYKDMPYKGMINIIRTYKRKKLRHD